MKQTIYVDVLVIINIYINYGLLLMTCMSRRLPVKRLKILLASLFGGVYSLIILVPGISDAAVSLSRIPALALMVLLSFGFISKREYIKNTLTFLAVNLVFGGAMLLLWLFICPQNMYYNGGVVYFGINAPTLVMMTVIAYAVIRVITYFTSGKIPSVLIYTLEIHFLGKVYSCRSFYDSGNTLTDPFSGEGVIIVNADVLNGAVNERIFDDKEGGLEEFKMKLIPVRAVSGSRLLPSFRAEKAIIKGLEKTFVLESPVIALCKEKICGGEYGALLYSSVFENTIEGEAYVLHNWKNLKENYRSAQ